MQAEERVAADTHIVTHSRSTVTFEKDSFFVTYYIVLWDNPAYFNSRVVQNHIHDRS